MVNRSEDCQHAEKVPFTDVWWCPECGATLAHREYARWLPIRCERTPNDDEGIAP